MSDEIRVLRIAIRNATTAFESRELHRLATVNETIQPLVDAAVRYAHQRVSETQRAHYEKTLDFRTKLYNLVGEFPDDGILSAIEELIEERNRLKKQVYMENLINPGVG